MAAQEEKAPHPSFRISYFPGAGRGEPIRLAAYIGGIGFEDEFLSYSEIQARRAKGDLRWKGVPQVTLYDAKGSVVAVAGQSSSLLRYCGQLVGLYPSNPVARLLVDEVIDSCEDCGAAISYKGLTDDAEKKKFREGLFAKDGMLTYWLNKFVLRLEENEKRGNKNGYFVGDTMTIADLKAYGSLNSLISGYFDHIPKDLYTKNHPRLAKFLDSVGSDKQIKQFGVLFDKNTADFKEKKVNSCVYTYAGTKQSYASF